MFARSGTFFVDPAHFEEALAFYGTGQAREYLGSESNVGGILLGNRATGKLLGVSLWPSPAEMEASEEDSQRLRVGVQRAGRGTTPIVRETWELLALDVTRVPRFIFAE